VTAPLLLRGRRGCAWTEVPPHARAQSPLCAQLGCKRALGGLEACAGGARALCTSGRGAERWSSITVTPSGAGVCRVPNLMYRTLPYLPYPTLPWRAQGDHLRGARQRPGGGADGARALHGRRGGPGRRRRAAQARAGRRRRLAAAEPAGAAAAGRGAGTRAAGRRWLAGCAGVCRAAVPLPGARAAAVARAAQPAAHRQPLARSHWPRRAPPHMPASRGPATEPPPACALVADDGGGRSRAELCFQRCFDAALQAVRPRRADRATRPARRCAYLAPWWPPPAAGAGDAGATGWAAAPSAGAGGGDRLTRELQHVTGLVHQALGDGHAGFRRAPAAPEGHGAWGACQVPKTAHAFRRPTAMAQRDSCQDSGTVL